jgi:glutathione S-transferase
MSMMAVMGMDSENSGGFKGGRITTQGAATELKKGQAGVANHGRHIMLAYPATILAAAVTVLTALICQGTAILVARTRHRFHVPPPAMTGAPEVERALRVQGNTVEQVLFFLPSLWMAVLYFGGWAPPILGLIWCLGRVLFAVGYMSAANRRGPGFMIGTLATIILVILAIIGIVQAWLAV